MKVRGFCLLLCLIILPGVSAGESRERGPAEPPHFRDEIHVANGCYLSTVAYLARFTAAFPDERGEAISIDPRNANGSSKPHTIALISWRGQWWGREEYYGVFPLRLPVDPSITPERLHQRAQSVCVNHGAALVSAKRIKMPPAAPRRLTFARRLADVEAAARIIPQKSQIFHVVTRREEIPVLLFRPAAGVIAVYEPLNGTASAECNWTDDIAVVKEVAQRLGYRADAVRARALDLHETDTLVARAD